MKRLFTGLWRHADFRKLWAGQTISLLGSQITALALPVAAALTLHATAFQMGLLTVAGSLPTILFGLLVGVGVDRFRRRPLLIGADLGRAVALLSIPLAALLGRLSMEQLYLVTFLSGSLTLLFNVAHLPWLPSLVSHEQLVEGNSKLELSRSGAVIVGPSIAGLLIQLVTAPLAIILDTLSFLGSAAFLARIRTKEQAPLAPSQESAIWSHLVAGASFILHHPILRSFLAGLSAFNFFSYMIGALYVLYVLRVLGVSPVWLGVIYAAGSIGFPLGALFAGPVARRLGTGPTIMWEAGVSNAAYPLILLAHGSLGICRAGADRGAGMCLVPQRHHGHQPVRSAPDVDSQRAARPREWSLALSRLGTRHGWRTHRRSLRANPRPAKHVDHCCDWHPVGNDHLTDLAVSSVS